MDRVYHGLFGGKRGREWSNSQCRRLIYTIAAVCTWILWSLSCKDNNNNEAVDGFFSSSSAVLQTFSDANLRALRLEALTASSPEEIQSLLRKVQKEIQHVLDSNKEFTKFGPRILDWDKQREIAKAKFSAANEDSHKSSTSTPAHEEKDDQQQLNSSTKPAAPRILLVTSTHPHACSNAKGDQLQLLAIKNKYDYCRLHNMQIFYNMNKMDDEMVGWWVKLFLTHMLMIRHPEVDWIWWMDSDAVITDMTFELPLHKYQNHNLVISGWEDAVYDKRSWIGLNAGVFLLRNCQWSLDLLHSWAPMSPKGPVRDAIGKLLSLALTDRPPTEADDQSSLVYLMLTDRSRWGSKIYLENSYCFQGYWLYLTDKFEEMMEKNQPGVYGDERWPFITHFVGCEFCEGGVNPIYSPGQCIRAMERAFLFADNQVLNRYGLRHSSLHTFRVQQKKSTNPATRSLPPPETRAHPSGIPPAADEYHDTTTHHLLLHNDTTDDQLHGSPIL